MTFLAMGFVGTVILAIAIMVWHKNVDNFTSFLSSIVAILISLILGVFLSIQGYEWVASGYKAAIINKEYGTSYSREEILYASDVINTIRELNRSRSEIRLDIKQTHVDSVVVPHVK